MNYFEKSVLINCPVEKVFEFHSDTGNLKKITPWFIKVKIIKMELPLRLNSEIILQITQFGLLRTKWSIQLTEFKPYSIITDTQTKGPFKKWQHSHCFESKDGKTLMTDKINYELPFGLIGKSVNKLFIKKMIGKQFKFRHNVTKSILGNQSGPD
jgi:ligand-binding SRPBCC domain-containing protein